MKDDASKGAVTNIDGEFSLEVQPGTLLEITYLGYNSQEVKAQNGMRIMLTEDVRTFDEVVVVGYGVQKRLMSQEPLGL